MRNRILSVFLALVMTLTLLPTAAWADEETGGNYEAGETGEFQEDGGNGENSGDVTGAAGNFVPGGGEDGGSDGPLDPVRLDPVEITYTGPEDWYTP